MTKADSTSLRTKSDISDLIDLSARLGRDPLLVQGSNGNTSIKLEGMLWIKASGRWLARAGEEELLVPVELAAAQRAMREGADAASACAVRDNLKPSIETAMHAVLRHRVVIHVHSINAIAWAIRKDAAIQLASRLAGLRWQLIPYAPSGTPLATEIERHVAAAPDTDVLVLGNHGLVVCGDDCASAEQLLREVERRLAIVRRKAGKHEAALLAAVSRASEWRLPELESLHSLSTDAISRKILQGGILYPCQALFLGEKMPLLPCSVPLSRFAEYFNGREQPRSFIVVGGCGVIVNQNITSCELATLVGHMEILQRTDESAPLSYLNAAEVASVLKDDPHRYVHSRGQEGARPDNCEPREQLFSSRPATRSSAKNSVTAGIRAGETP